MADTGNIDLIEKNSPSESVAKNITDDGIDDSLQKETDLTKAMDFLMDQDTQQMVGAIGILGAQLYQALIGSMLLLFVPQDCGGELCPMSDRLGDHGGLYTFGLFLNFLTLFSLCTLYLIESRREKYLITEMDTNLDYPNDGEEVGERLPFLPVEVLAELKHRNLWYGRAGYFSAVFFLVNSIVSALVINDYVLGSQTWSTFSTNFLAVAFKIMDVYSTISTEDNVFLSAYLKTKVQFNDIDSFYHTEESERALNESEASERIEKIKASNNKKMAAHKIPKKTN